MGDATETELRVVALLQRIQENVQLTRAEYFFLLNNEMNEIRNIDFLTKLCKCLIDLHTLGELAIRSHELIIFKTYGTTSPIQVEFLCIFKLKI